VPEFIDHLSDADLNALRTILTIALLVFGALAVEQIK
jgi:hypothetical protein